MKDHIKYYIIIPVLSMLLVYIGTSFVYLNLNPFSLPIGAREGIIIAWALLTILMMIVYSIIDIK